MQNVIIEPSARRILDAVQASPAAVPVTAEADRSWEEKRAEMRRLRSELATSATEERERLEADREAVVGMLDDIDRRLAELAKDFPEVFPKQFSNATSAQELKALLEYLQKHRGEWVSSAMLGKVFRHHTYGAGNVLQPAINQHIVQKQGKYKGTMYRCP